MSNFKLNNADDYEYFMLGFNASKFPIAYQNKAEELIEQGLTAEEVHVGIPQEFAMEVYYHKGCGLFAVEAETISCGAIPRCPYCGQIMEDNDDI